MVLQQVLKTLILGVVATVLIACENAKPDIDAADVTVLKLTSVSAQVLVQGSNLGWFQGIQLEDSNGDFIPTTIQEKSDGVLTIVPSAPLTIGQSYRIILDAGTKIRFRTEPLVLDAITSPTVEFTSVSLVGGDQMLQASGSCNVTAAVVRLIVTHTVDLTTTFADTTCDSNSSWNVGLYTVGIADGTLQVEVQYTGSIVAPTASVNTEKDTIAPVLTLVGGLPTPGLRSNALSVSPTFDYDDANSGSIAYAYGAGGCGPADSTFANPSTVIPSVTLPAVEGVVYYCVQATDAFGNASPIQTFAWIRDTVAPTFSGGSPFSVDDGNATSPAEFSWEFTGLTAIGEILTDETYATYALYDGAACGAPSLSIGSGSTLPTMSLPFDLIDQTSVGPRNVSIILTDTAGNSSCTTTSIYIDRFTPLASQFYVNDGNQVSPDGTVSIQVTGVDNQATLWAEIFNNDATCSGTPVTGPIALYSGTPTSSSFAHGLPDQGAVQHYVRISDPSGRSSCTPASNPFQYSLTITPKYGNSFSYNEWARTSDPNLTCDSASPADCSWIGQYRKVVTGENSCAGLSISEIPMGDDLFNWSCTIESGRAVFHGKLFPNRRLSDLFSNASGSYSWKSKSVMLNGATTSATSSPSIALYSGSIFDLSLSGGSRFYLSTAGATYVVPTAAAMLTGGITIDAPKISVVSEDPYSNAKLVASNLQPEGGIYPVIMLGPSAMYTHVDVEIDVPSVDFSHYAIVGSQAHFSRIRSKRINTESNGLDFDMTHGLEISDLNLQGSGGASFKGVNVAFSNSVKAKNVHAEQFGTGISFQNSLELFAYNLSATENASEGMNFSNVTEAKLTGLRAFNNNTGAGVTVSGTGVTVQNVLSTGNGTTGGGKGLVLNTCSNCIVQNVLTAKHYTHGTTVSGANNIVMNVTSYHDSSYGILLNSSNATASRLSSFSSGNYQFGIQSFDPTIVGPLIGSGTSPMFILSGGAAITPTLDWNPGSDPTVDGPTLVSIYENYFDFVASYAANWMSTFGKSTGSGKCVFGSCYRTTWIPLNSDIVMLGNGAFPQLTEMVNPVVSTCPAYLHGNETITANGKTYLKNAFEVINPNFTVYGPGNHDGLCESNETCVAMPNMGVYQGHGGLQICNFQSGTVSGVNMVGYTQNGLSTSGEIVATGAP